MVDGQPQGFDWYQSLPDGVQCKMHSHAENRRSISLFQHSLPRQTDLILDRSNDPVVSMALNPRGAVEREVDGRWERAVLAKDTLTLTPAQTECRWRWSGEPLDIVDVYIPFELMQQVSREHFDTGAAEVNLLPRLALSEESISFSIRSMLSSAHMRGAHAGLLRETMTLYLIGSLLAWKQSTVSVSHQDRSTLSNAALKRVEEFVQANIAETISLQAMADVARVSRFHFLRLFRAKVGTTPYAYVTEKRIARACVLLSSTDLPVSEIAAECGFEDPSYFSACFRQRRGISPRDYRRSTC